MEHLHWSSRPALRSPVLVAAFTGWNDAGDAASLAVRHLAHEWDAEVFAELDPEEFVDFHGTRPQVRLVDGETREIVWPTTELLWATTAGADVVLVTGPEPQLRWRSYCRHLVEAAEELGTSLVVTLGALLADVPHRRPVSVIGTASDRAMIQRFGLQRSRYEGPTGIVGCLQDACAKAGLAAVSLWAAVPAYAPGTTSPKAAAALVQRAAGLVGTPVDVSTLDEAVAEYEAEVDDYVGRDEDLASYVERLEAIVDEGDVDDDDDPAADAPPAVPDTGSAERLVAEVEQFLRDQGSD
jgi:predicted ATP-grasp superfamily ATP-dependent carboligase